MQPTRTSDLKPLRKAALAHTSLPRLGKEYTVCLLSLADCLFRADLANFRRYHSDTRPKESVETIRSLSVSRLLQSFRKTQSCTV